MSRSDRRSHRVEPGRASSLISSHVRSGNDGESPAARSSGRTQHVRAEYVARLAAELSERDRTIIKTVKRLRVVTGEQLERLHFTDLAESSRPVMRRRVLTRLVRLRLLVTLERHIGGVRAG